MTMTAQGLVNQCGPIGLDRLIDVATAGPGGRLVVELVDLLAIVGLGVAADLLMVELGDGSSVAVPLGSITGGSSDHLFVLGPDGASDSVVVRWAAAPGRGEVVSIDAITFATFVSAR